MDCAGAAPAAGFGCAVQSCDGVCRAVQHGVRAHRHRNTSQGCHVLPEQVFEQGQVRFSCRSRAAAHLLASNPISATASVLQMASAARHIDVYPSVAEDAQTNPLRKATHLLQRTVNSLHGTMEISDQQVKCARAHAWYAHNIV
jgi:hypothetical protein